MPGWMLKRNDFDVIAEFLEDRFVGQSFAVFGEGEQVNFVVPRDPFQQMKGAVISAAVERVRDVGIDRENLHLIKISPDILISFDKRGKVAARSEKLFLTEPEEVGLAGDFRDPEQERQGVQEALARISGAAET